MASEWEKVRLAEIVDIKTGKLDSNQATDKGKYPFFTCAPEPLGIDSFAFDCEAILLAGNNANGIFHINRFNGKFNAYQRTYVVTTKTENCIQTDIGFIYYTLQTLLRRLEEYSQGTATKFLTKTILDPLPIPLPPLPTQRAIARILGALDDKIELNRRMNRTLEALARALFKSWFVDFEPVRAKMEGRAPEGLDAQTAALFPDRLVDSELGEVPEGWEWGTAGEVVGVVGGSTPSTDEPTYWNGTFNFATPKDLSGLQQPVLLETERCITEAGLAKISSGLLPKGTLLLSSRAPIGYLAITDLPLAINQGFIAMTCKGDVSAHFMLNWCWQNRDEIVSRANGSTFLEISKANFRPIPFLKPSAQVLKRFDDSVSGVYYKIAANARESRTLAALRDALLPRLLNGEVIMDTLPKGDYF